MSITEPDKEEQEEQQRSNVVQLRPVPTTGGADPDNWLIRLPSGCIFLCCKRTSNDPWLEEFNLACKTTEGMVLLIQDLNTTMRVWVDSLVFSKIYKKVEVNPYAHVEGEPVEE